MLTDLCYLAKISRDISAVLQRLDCGAGQLSNKTMLGWPQRWGLTHHVWNLFPHQGRLASYRKGGPFQTCVLLSFKTWLLPQAPKDLQVHQMLFSSWTLSGPQRLPIYYNSFALPQRFVTLAEFRGLKTDTTIYSWMPFVICLLPLPKHFFQVSFSLFPFILISSWSYFPKKITEWSSHFSLWWTSPPTILSTSVSGIFKIPDVNIFFYPKPFKVSLSKLFFKNFLFCIGV